MKIKIIYNDDNKYTYPSSKIENNSIGEKNKKKRMEM